MSVTTLNYHKNRTSGFKYFPNVVGFIDGKILPTLSASDQLTQSRDYNLWKSSHFRKMVLVWDTYGRCVDV